MKYIKRSIEDIVESSADTFKAVLITGARQTGKSTLLEKLYPDRKMITFDDMFLEDQAENDPEMFMTLHQPPITMDEVQRVPKLFRYIKMSCDFNTYSFIMNVISSNTFSENISFKNGIFFITS